MVKNFFEYVKEIVPEKGSAFFTFENHFKLNALSLYQLADLIQGKKIVSKFPLFEHAVGVSGYSWNVVRMFRYDFDTVGIFLEFDDGTEKWIHFSKDAFIGAVCLVATQNGVTFDDAEHEALRQAWENKDPSVTEKNQSNFNEEWYAGLMRQKKMEKNLKLSNPPKDKKPIILGKKA